MYTKPRTCEHCAVTYTRRPNEARSTFLTRRFCGHACYEDFLRGAPADHNGYVMSPHRWEVGEVPDVAFVARRPGQHGLAPCDLTPSQTANTCSRIDHFGGNRWARWWQSLDAINASLDNAASAAD